MEALHVRMALILLPTTTVTHELGQKDSPLRVLLRPHQPLLDRWRTQMITQLSGRPWIRPANVRRAWMSGHAIDYRARWSLTGVTDLPDTVMAGLAKCNETTRRELIEAFVRVVGTSPGVIDADVERAVCTVAVAAASVEPLYRVGPVPCALQDLGLAEFTTEYTDVIDDVVALAAGLPTLFADFAGRKITPGPVVGIGRPGGDADLVAGNELVEIKCVTDPKASATKLVQQLLVYAARLRPKTASLVLPRQHTRVLFNLAIHQTALEQINVAIEAEYGGLSEFRCNRVWVGHWLVGNSRSSNMMAKALSAGFQRTAHRCLPRPVGSRDLITR